MDPTRAEESLVVGRLPFLVCAPFLHSTLPGTPATTEWSGMVPRTTVPAAMAQLRPTSAPGSTTTLVPIHVPAPIRTGSHWRIWRPTGSHGSA